MTSKQVKVPVYRLSRREKEVLKWAASGMTSFEISKIMSVSEETIRTQVKAVIRRLDARKKTHAVVKALS